MTTLTDNAKKFLKRNPTLIGDVGGAKFYEDPTYGDETPLIVITVEGRKHSTEFWELPTLDEVINNTPNYI